MTTPNLFLNTSGVSWTGPSGGAAVLNRITQAGLTFNADVINNRADLDVYDSSAHLVGWKPTVTFAGLNVGLYLSLISGIGTITWTIGNADSPGGTGSIVYTLDPAMNPLGDYSGQHAAYATGNLSFMGLAADGATNPLSSTVVSSGSFVGRNADPPSNIPAMKGMRLGMAFLPPPPKGDAPAEGAPVDAVFLAPDHWTLTRTRSHFRNICAAQVEAAKILKCDPDEVRMRRQGVARIYTPSPKLQLYHEHGSGYRGHRLAWHPGPDGSVLGYLTDDARQADQDEADDAA